MSVKLTVPALLAGVVIVALCHAAANETTTVPARPDESEGSQKVRLSLSLLWGGKKVLLIAENPTKKEIPITEPGSKQSHLIVVQPSGKRVAVEVYPRLTQQRRIAPGTTLVWQEGFFFEKRFFSKPGIYRLRWEMGNLHSPELKVHVLPKGAEDLTIWGRNISDVFDMKKLCPKSVRSQQIEALLRRYPNETEALQTLDELQERWRKEDAEKATSVPGKVDQ